MKTQQILSIVFALLFVTTISVRANVKGGSGISSDAKFAYSLRAVKGTNKFVLSFDNLSKEKVSIKIYDAANTLVFSETQHDVEESRERYDLSALGEGSYTVKIESGDYSFTEEIRIGQANDMSFESTIAPDSNDTQKLRVGFANAKGSVRVVIKDASGNVVHSETFNHENGNQLFNMEELSAGVYSITVENSNSSHTDTYEVK